MNARIFIFSIALWVPAVIAGNSNFNFSRPIQWQGSDQQELLAVSLDSRIYAATRDGFPDLRLFDDNDIETPYLLEKEAETRSETRRLSCGVKLDSLKKKEKAIEIQLTLDKDACTADGLTVVTPFINFEHRIKILGSIDGKNWTAMVSDATIFDYSAFMAISNRDVVLPANQFRKFKVLIEEATHTRESELIELSGKLQKGNEIERKENVTMHRLQRVPLKIDRIEFWHTETEVLPASDKTFDYSVAKFDVSEDVKNKTTIIDIDTDREPLTGFRLQFSGSNFKRSAVVQTPIKRGIETLVQTIGTAMLESIHFREINRDQTTINFPLGRLPAYRIVIDNKDNPPLAVKAVSGIGPAYRLLFLPVEGKTYLLRYGSEKAQAPRYDTVTIQELLRRGYQSTAVVLGKESPEKAVPEAFDWNTLFNSKLFLSIVVTITVIVLGWSLVRVSKRIEETTKN